MSYVSVFLAVGLMCILLLCATGCALPAIEGAEAGHVAMAGDYDEITPVAAGALAQYNVQKALIQWEPRIDQITVNVTMQPAIGCLSIDIRYRVRSTNTFYNLTFRRT